METDENAGQYMISYGEGPGSDTRHVLSNFINIGETVLDVGCGPGHNYDHFQEYGPAIKDYLGLDYSKRFVRAANQRNPGKYLFGDCRDLPMPDNSWDVVIMQDVLEHTNGYEKPLDEALRVARKRIIVAFWHLMDKDEDNSINDDGDDGWGAWYSRSKWEKYLDKLKLDWFHHQIIDQQGKARDFYVIEREA